jgi:hypothetical protein
MNKPPDWEVLSDMYGPSEAVYSTEWEQQASKPVARCDSCDGGKPKRNHKPGLILCVSCAARIAAGKPEGNKDIDNPQPAR